MVRDKNEFVSVANQWVGFAKADMSRQMNAFMRKTGATIAEVADILDVTEATAEGILRGSADIPLSVFARILIATDHVIAIMPASEAPTAGLTLGTRAQGFMPPRGGMRPTAPMGHRRPTEETENRQRQNGPARDANGRFTRRRPMPAEPAMPEPENMGFGYPLPPMGGNVFPNENMNMTEDFGEEMPDTAEAPRAEAPQTDSTMDAVVAALRALAQSNPTLANALRNAVR